MSKDMINNKIKQLLLASNKTQTDIANDFKITRQAFCNKLCKGTFKIEDLIKISESTNTTLAFLDKDGDIVVKFDKEDIKKRG